MSEINRDEVAWYYRLGGHTLGPVSWVEIEQLTRDSMDADKLLVARGGDEKWKSAADVLAERPELAAEPEAPATEPVAAPVPVGAPAQPLRAAGGAFIPVHGLSQWISQAWEMVIGEVWPWVGAMLLWTLIGGVTIGIASPPLMVGLYMMALERFAGKPLKPSDIFTGFSRFLPAWGLTLVMSIPGLLIVMPAVILIVIPVIAAGGDSDITETIGVGMAMGMQLLMPVLWLLIVGIQAIFFYAFVLVAEGRGAWESVVLSWEKVKPDFWSYVGMFLILSFVSSLGSYACYVGMLLSYPLMPCAQVAAYRWHFRRELT